MFSSVILQLDQQMRQQSDVAYHQLLSHARNATVTQDVNIKLKSRVEFENCGKHLKSSGYLSDPGPHSAPAIVPGHRAACARAPVMIQGRPFIYILLVDSSGMYYYIFSAEDSAIWNNPLLFARTFRRPEAPRFST
jgi:hypothetical protein